MVRKDYWSLIMHILFVVLGLFLIIRPADGLSTLFFALSIVILLIGLFLLIQYFVSKIKPHSIHLILAAVILAIGLMLLIFNKQLANTLLPLLIGLSLLISGFFRVWVLIMFRRASAFLWWMPCLSGILSLILGLVVLFNLSGTSVFLSVVLGIGLLIGGICGFGEVYTFAKIRNK